MVTSETLPVIALTMGDPAGVGPEIIVKALSHRDLRRRARYLVLGDAEIMRRAAAGTDSGLLVEVVDGPLSVGSDPGRIYVQDLRNVAPEQFAYGRLSAMCGRAAFEAIEAAIDLANEKRVAAVVTAPLNKEALRLAGIEHAGHTEIFAKKTDTRDYAMMLAEGDFRVVHVSTHVSLREAIERTKKPRVRAVIELAHNALKKLGIEDPRIAVAGLNPHAGENGLFGTEEIDEIIPAIEEAKKDGRNVDGPIPPDTVFSKMQGGQYDIVVVMYHDQGHIPTKLAGFKYDRETNTWLSMSGVNVTLGLPIIRSSVDHGVAFGKAGEGRANEESMIQALEMAVRLV